MVRIISNHHNTDLFVWFKNIKLGRNLLTRCKYYWLKFKLFRGEKFIMTDVETIDNIKIFTLITDNATIVRYHQPPGLQKYDPTKLEIRFINYHIPDDFQLANDDLNVFIELLVHLKKDKKVNIKHYRKREEVLRY